MGTILFDKISHIEYREMHVTDIVNCIKAGEIYQPIFDTVEDSVLEEDTRKGFWAKFWGEGLFPKYKAAEDRWDYKQTIGTIKFIEDNHPEVKHIAGEWFLTPKLVVHYLDKTTTVLYFNTDAEMFRYADVNFPGFRGLEVNQPKKIKVG